MRERKGKVSKERKGKGKGKEGVWIISINLVQEFKINKGK